LRPEVEGILERENGPAQVRIEAMGRVGHMNWQDPGVGSVRACRDEIDAYIDISTRENGPDCTG
jgi:hypothetical protein